MISLCFPKKEKIIPKLETESNTNNVIDCSLNETETEKSHRIKRNKFEHFLQSSSLNYEKKSRKNVVMDFAIPYYAYNGKEDDQHLVAKINMVDDIVIFSCLESDIESARKSITEYEKKEIELNKNSLIVYFFDMQSNTTLVLITPQVKKVAHDFSVNVVKI